MSPTAEPIIAVDGLGQLAADWLAGRPAPGRW